MQLDLGLAPWAVGNRDILGGDDSMVRPWLTRGPAGRQADWGEDDGLLGRWTEELDAGGPGPRALPSMRLGRKVAGPPPLPSLSRHHGPGFDGPGQRGPRRQRGWTH